MAKDDHKEDGDDIVKVDSNNANVKKLREEKASILLQAEGHSNLSQSVDELLSLEKRARLVTLLPIHA